MSKISLKRDEIVKYIQNNKPEMMDKIDFIVRMYIKLEKDMDDKNSVNKSIPKYKKTEKEKDKD
jgi:hypothetical protein|tara:strand:- start:613 stop:804 length:192 start_codon:yes stop_codon:yes gene_type:complete